MLLYGHRRALGPVCENLHSPPRDMANLRKYAQETSPVADCENMHTAKIILPPYNSDIVTAFGPLSQSRCPLAARSSSALALGRRTRSTAKLHGVGRPSRRFRGSCALSFVVFCVLFVLNTVGRERSFTHLVVGPYHNYLCPNNKLVVVRMLARRRLRRRHIQYRTKLTATAHHLILLRPWPRPCLGPGHSWPTALP